VALCAFNTGTTPAATQPTTNKGFRSSSISTARAFTRSAFFSLFT